MVVERYLAFKLLLVMLSWPLWSDRICQPVELAHGEQVRQSEKPRGHGEQVCRLVCQSNILIYNVKR